MIHEFTGHIGKTRQKEFNDFLDKPFDKSLRKLIVAPTAAGKTTAVVKYAKENSDKRIALLCPYISLIQNLSTDHDVPCGSGKNWLNKYQNNPFLITTYDSIKRLRDMDMLVIDETHLLGGHAGFRDVIVDILDSKVPVVFITATPEVVEHLFDKNEEDIDGRVMRLDRKKTRQKHVNMWTNKRYDPTQTIIDIIEENIEKKPNKTVMIRINSKAVINHIFDLYKNSINICFAYSDEDNVIYEGQDPDKVDELKQGKIEGIDFLLCTSIYDAGLSFIVDRDVDCYAVSQDARCMPNPINMIQLVARVRPSSGYIMDLTIIGNTGNYSPLAMPLGTIESASQVRDLMAVMYEQYTKLSSDEYINLLGCYDIIVNHKKESGIKSAKRVYASKVTDFQIIKNFVNFKDEYTIIERMLSAAGQEHQLSLITGKTVIGSRKSAQVQLIFNVLKRAIELEIDYDLFLSEDSFSKRMYGILETLMSTYSDDSNCSFSRCVDGMAYEENKTFYFKELGFFDLNTNDKKVIKSLFHTMYEEVNFRGAKGNIVLKENTNMKVVELVQSVSGLDVEKESITSDSFGFDDVYVGSMKVNYQEKLEI